MFFFLAKLLGPLTDPALILEVTVLVAAVAALARRRRLAYGFLGIAAAVILLLGVLPGGLWLALPLESRFTSHPRLPDDVAGIITLGGTERMAQSSTWGQPILSDPAPIAALIALGRRYPRARLVFSGGSPAPHDDNFREAEVVHAFLDEIGFDAERVTYERRSRNTRENAILTRDLVAPKPGEKWVLVTQAISMPRAVGAFRAAGWNVIPYPAGYLSGSRHGGLSLEPLGGLALASIAIHEWAGLVVYRLLGYTDTLFPG